MKEKILILVLVCIATVLYVGGKNMKEVKKVREGIEFGQFKQVKIGDRLLTLEIADSHQERVRGLSGHESLDEGKGLLFVFPKKEKHGIWMKDMSFSIDIIWLDEDFNVVGLKSEASPETYPEVFYPDSPAKYVLEINSGILEKEKIKIGETLNFF